MSVKKYLQYIKYLKEQDESQPSAQESPQNGTTGFVNSDNTLNKVNSYILGKIKDIKSWFNNGEFGNSSLYDINNNIYSGQLNKNIIFSFSDDNYYYQIELTLRLEDYKDGVIDKAFLKVKKYSLSDNQENINLDGILIDEWDSNNPENNQENGQINLNEFNSKFILDILSKMEEEPNAIGSKNNQNSQENNTETENEF